MIHTPLAPWALALSLISAAIVLLDLYYPTRNLMATLGTLGLAYALFHLTDVPNAPHRVHPLTAILTATAFTVVTLKLGRIALLARRNKAIQPKPAQGTID